MKPHFFATNIPSYSSYVSGIDKTLKIWHYFGLVYVGRQFWGCVGGFNENLIYYGRDDEDFADRLSATGLHRDIFDRTSIYHIPHGDEDRIGGQIHLKETVSRDEDDDDQEKARLVSVADLRYMFTTMNEQIETQLPWSNRSRKIHWDISEIEPNRLQAVRQFQPYDQ